MLKAVLKAPCVLLSVCLPILWDVQLFVHRVYGFPIHDLA